MATYNFTIILNIDERDELSSNIIYNTFSHLIHRKFFFGAFNVSVRDEKYINTNILIRKTEGRISLEKIRG